MRLFEYFRWQLHTQKPNGAHVVAKREKNAYHTLFKQLGAQKKFGQKSLNNTSKGQILLVLIILNININNFMGLRPRIA